MTSVTYRKGVSVASAAAGPLFLLVVAMFSGLPRSVDMQMLGMSLFALTFSIPIGFAIAAVPNLLSAALLASLGRANDGVRLPAFWGLVGARLGGAIDAIVAASGSTSGPGPLFTLIALASALLCRAGTRWTDGRGCHA